MINAAAIGAITSAFDTFSDIEPALTNVRFQGNKGHDADVARCLLMTRSGHGPTPKTASGVPARRLPVSIRSLRGGSWRLARRMQR